MAAFGVEVLGGNASLGLNCGTKGTADLSKMWWDLMAMVTEHVYSVGGGRSMPSTGRVE